jgi:hypothetical protein
MNTVMTTFIDSTIAENRVIAKYDAQGGGYYSTSQTLSMARCSISANSLQVRQGRQSTLAIRPRWGVLCGRQWQRGATMVPYHGHLTKQFIHAFIDIEGAGFERTFASPQA